MNADKKAALAHLLTKIIEEAIEVGAAKQRHQDAALDEAEAEEDLRETVSLFGDLINGHANVERTTLN